MAISSMSRQTAAVSGSGETLAISVRVTMRPTERQTVRPHRGDRPGPEIVTVEVAVGGKP